MKQLSLLMSLFAASLLGACSSFSSFRNTVPPAGPSPVLVAPQAVVTQLPNGLTIYTVEKKNLPLIHTSIVFKSGSASDAADLPGLAAFTNGMLKNGTTTRSANEIADAVETRGSSIGSGVGGDSSQLSFTALTENFSAVLEVFADVVQNPAFQSEEIERQRLLRLTALAQAGDNPGRTADKVFNRTLFGEHPYGHTTLGEEAAVKSITKANLRSFYKAHYRPENAAIILVGDISSQAAADAIKEKFGRWTGAPGATPSPATPSPANPGIFLVDKPDAPQSQLRIGHLGVSRANPDYFSIILCNAILGGAFNSRINMNLREDKGYTDGAGSYFDFRRGMGPFTVYTGVRTDVTLPAVEEILGELNKMRETDVTAEELKNAKNRYSLSLPGQFQTVGGIASMFSRVFTFDLPLDYYQHLPEKLAAVSVDDVRTAAQTYLHPEDLIVVVVGDKTKVSKELGKLSRGDLQERDSAGNPL